MVSGFTGVLRVLELGEQHGAELLQRVSGRAARGSLGFPAHMSTRSFQPSAAGAQDSCQTRRPPARAGEHAAIRHVAFAIGDIDAVGARLRALSANSSASVNPKVGRP
jgi:hypothetical protein